MSTPATASTPTIKKVARQIQFFRAMTPTDAAGAPKPVKLAAMLTHLRALPFVDGDAGAYLEIGEGTGTACFEVAKDRLVFASLRRTSLPRIEDGKGNLRDLGLAVKDGIFEPVHVRFFPDNIVGVDFNFYGPRIGRLEKHLHAKVPIATRGSDFSLAALFRHEPLKQLNRLASLKMIDLKLQRSHLAELETLLGGPMAQIRSVATFGNAETVELRLVAEPGKDSHLGKTLADWVRKFVKKDTALAAAERLKVGGFDTVLEKSNVFDRLQDRLVSSKEMLTIDPRTRVVTSDSAFKAIEAAYAELKADLEKAVSVDV